MNKVRLGSIASLKTGPFGTQFSAKEYTETGVPVINVKNIGYGEVIENDLDYISEETKNRLSEHILMQGDIVFGRKGSVDRHAYISENYEGWVQGSDCIRVRCDDEINKKYISHYLKLNHIKKMVNNAAVGSTMASMNTDILRDIEILLPELKVQNKIERIVSLIEAKICLNRKINDNLLQQATGIFEYWFKQFNYPTPNNTPYKSSGGSLYWNDKVNRYIPMEITNITVGEITICHDSKRIPLSNNERLEKQGTIPYYGATGIMDYVDDYIFNGDYVLLAEDGSVMTDQGTPILQRITGKSWVNNHAHVLEPVEGYSCLLLYMLLKDIPVVQIKTGSIQYKINQQNLNAYQVLCLPEYLRKLYIQKTVAIESEMLKIQSENQKLISLRDWLLPMLMNGQATIDD